MARQRPPGRLQGRCPPPAFFRLFSPSYAVEPHTRLLVRGPTLVYSTLTYRNVISTALNVTFFDILKKLDTSKSYKYLPLLCKIFGRRFNFKKEFPDSFMHTKLEVEATLINKGISTINLSDNELYVYHTFMEFFPSETFYTFKEFVHYMEKNQIDKDSSSNVQVTDSSDCCGEEMNILFVPARLGWLLDWRKRDSLQKAGTRR